jgi:hypothetical protein
VRAHKNYVYDLAPPLGDSQKKNLPSWPRPLSLPIKNLHT